MAKAIKALIVILFLLTAGALYLGIELFNQREMISSRLTTLEKSAMTVAKNLRYEDLDANALKDHEKVAKQLYPLEVVAQTTIEDLDHTKLTLQQTEDTLKQTEATLATTEQNLENAKNEIVDLNKDIENKETQIADLESEVEDLEVVQNELNEKIEELDDQITTKDNEIDDWIAKYDSLKEDYDTEVRRNLASKGAEGVVTPSDLVGHVLSVNSEWNFVVLDIGSESGLKANAEMLVHRDKTLVGKIRVSDVREQMAVAEILNDWEQIPVNKGDAVISPQS